MSTLGDSSSLEIHEYWNQALLTGYGGDPAESLPTNDVWGQQFVMWAHDIGAVVKREIPADKLETYENKANTSYGNAGGLKKNGLQIAAKLQFAFEDGIKPPSLEKLCDVILKFTR